MSEPPVVNASPLIYLAHCGLIDLLKMAGEPVLVPTPVSGEIRLRGPADPTVMALDTTPWLEEVEVVAVSSRVAVWDLGPGESYFPGLSLIRVVRSSLTTWPAAAALKFWESPRSVPWVSCSRRSARE